MLNKKGISVIICCYNSADRLPETLSYLAKQQHVTFDWEVVVVDNASTDRTSEIARSEWETYRVDAGFVIVEEPTPGLSSARAKGISVAQYEYLLFCDDDNWLKEDFLVTAFQLMEENPQIGMLGGQSQAISDIELPDWFFEKSIVYAVGKQATASGPLLDDNQVLYGACMIVRKSILQLFTANDFRFFNTDRFGNSLSSGGDTELAKAMRLANYQLFYDERLKFKHYIPVTRLNWSYFLNLGKGSASSGVPIFAYDCLLRYPKMGILGFTFRYKFNILILFLKLLKRPVTVYRYCFNIIEEGDLESFEVMRLVKVLRTFIAGFAFGTNCFQQIKKFKKNIGDTQICSGRE